MSEPKSYVPDPKMLKRLAKVAVRTGLNVQPGQDVVLTAPVVALPLVRAITSEANRAGAALVTPLLADDGITLARYEHSTDAGFDRAADWLYRGMADAYASNAARLAIYAEDPQLLAGQNPDHVARAAKANAVAYKVASDYISSMKVNWSITSYPAPAWAARVFPELPEAQATEKLARAIFAVSRITGDDPVAGWRTHAAALAERVGWLNGQAFDALHFRAEGTDLVVGLAEGHRWLGGSVTAQNGVTCIPNIPTEEVFTTPHSTRVAGVVRFGKPLALQGNLVENIEMKFEGGRAVKASASAGEALLTELISRDDGAAVNERSKVTRLQRLKVTHP